MRETARERKASHGGLSTSRTKKSCSASGRRCRRSPSRSRLGSCCETPAPGRCWECRLDRVSLLPTAAARGLPPLARHGGRTLGRRAHVSSLAPAVIRCLCHGCLAVVLFRAAITFWPASLADLGSSVLDVCCAAALVGRCVVDLCGWEGV